MSKEFNFEMDRYLEKQCETEPIVVRSQKKNIKKEKSVSELYPELDSGVPEIHVINKENKAKKLFNNYKNKVLSLLKKEEKEIEKIQMPEKEEEIEEAIEEIEETVQKDVKEQVTMMQRFNRFFSNLFGNQEKIDEEEYQEPEEVQTNLSELDEETEVDFEEEVVMETKSGGWWQNFLIKLGIKENHSSVEEPISEEYEPKSINKVVLYKAKLENDTKLALMIAEKYLNELPMGARDKFERSGDKKVFDETLNRLKLK